MVNVPFVIDHLVFSKTNGRWVVVHFNSNSVPQNLSIKYVAVKMFYNDLLRSWWVIIGMNNSDTINFKKFTVYINWKRNKSDLITLYSDFP